MATQDTEESGIGNESIQSRVRGSGWRHRRYLRLLDGHVTSEVNIVKIIKPKGGHIFENRHLEIALGVLAFFIGCALLYDAFDNRGKKMPWPAGGLAPW